MPRYASTPQDHQALMGGTLKLRSGKVAAVIIAGTLAAAGVAVLAQSSGTHLGPKIGPRYHKLHRHA